MTAMLVIYCLSMIVLYIVETQMPYPFFPIIRTRWSLNYLYVYKFNSNNLFICSPLLAPRIIDENYKNLIDLVAPKMDYRDVPADNNSDRIIVRYRNWANDIYVPSQIQYASKADIKKLLVEALEFKQKVDKEYQNNVNKFNKGE